MPQVHTEPMKTPKEITEQLHSSDMEGNEFHGAQQDLQVNDHDISGHTTVVYDDAYFRDGSAERLEHPQRE